MKDGSGSAKRKTPPPLSAYTGEIPCADILNCLIGQFEMSYKTIFTGLGAQKRGIHAGFSLQKAEQES